MTPATAVNFQEKLPEQAMLPKKAPGNGQLPATKKATPAQRSCGVEHCNWATAAQAENFPLREYR